jgi:hypothetical protein
MQRAECRIKMRDDALFLRMVILAAIVHAHTRGFGAVVCARVAAVDFPGALDSFARRDRALAARAGAFFVYNRGGGVSHDGYLWRDLIFPFSPDSTARSIWKSE